MGTYFCYITICLLTNIVCELLIIIILLYSDILPLNAWPFKTFSSYILDLTEISLWGTTEAVLEFRTVPGYSVHMMTVIPDISARPTIQSAVVTISAAASLGLVLKEEFFKR